ncbi:MAG: GNAT family N-acetyltransferase [candidate division Zixibacteria bacterium]|nr:GNAT family N-acetyltransferase [candidate division Zixibacteria bacterium]
MITIRELRTGDDLGAVLTLCKAFFAEYETHHEEFFDTDNLSDADISGRFLESLESDRSATIIALVDNEIVGYASVAVREQPRFYKIKKVGAISALMVATKYRRKGIGTRLLEEARVFFRRRGIKYFTLYTASANKSALELYKRVGLSELHTSFLGDTEAF